MSSQPDNITDLSVCEKELKGKNHAVRLMCEDWAETHTHLQKLCREVGYDEATVEGDSYWVPGVIELADLLRARIDSTNNKDARQ